MLLECNPLRSSPLGDCQPTRAPDPSSWSSSDWLHWILPVGDAVDGVNHFLSLWIIWSHTFQSLSHSLCLTQLDSVGEVHHEEAVTLRIVERNAVRAECCIVKP